MTAPARLVPCLLLALAACSKPAADSGREPPGAEGESQQAAPGGAVAELRKHVERLAARSEKDLARCKVQHLLVAFAGSGVDGVRRTKDEAERLAAELYAKVLAGADFDSLVEEHTDDAHPGIYVMLTSGGQPPTTYDRGGMVPAFGNTGWRLGVGEVGVAAWHATDSPYGWHIVKRLE